MVVATLTAMYQAAAAAAVMVARAATFEAALVSCAWSEQQQQLQYQQMKQLFKTVSKTRRTGTDDRGKVECSNYDISSRIIVVVFSVVENIINNSRGIRRGSNCNSSDSNS